MKRLIPISTLLSVLVVLGAFPVAFASHARPFNGGFSGSFILLSPTKAAITATGHLEHLGRAMLAGTATDTGPAACEGGATAIELDTFTAANGDEIFSTANDVACPTSTTGAFQLTASFTITGGTGRFAGTSGSGTTLVSAVMTSATSGTFSGTTTGTITY